MKNNPWQMIRPTQDTLLVWTLCISIVLHAIVLAIEFKYPGTVRSFSSQALDIIQVNSRSKQAPENPQALAQHNLDGGGDVDEPVRAQTPLPPEVEQKEGAEVDMLEKQSDPEKQKPEQQIMAAQEASQPEVKVKPAEENKPSETEAIKPSGDALLSSTRELLKLQAEISKETVKYNERPRRQSIGARTQESRFAYYLNSWRDKVERVGTLNFPEKLYGSMILTVVIRSDGSVENIIIERPSGIKALDDAAHRIVRRAAPFAEFPPNIKVDTDVLDITRTWTFTSKNELETKALR